MAYGGQIMRFKLDYNEILLYNCPPCALNWNLMKPTNMYLFLHVKINENVFT